MKPLVLLVFLILFPFISQASISKEVKEAFGPAPKKAHAEEKSRIEQEIKEHFNQKYHEALSLIYAESDPETHKANLIKAFKILKEADLQRFNIDALIDYSILLYQFKQIARKNLLNKIANSRSYYYTDNIPKNFKGLPFQAEDLYYENSELFNDKVDNLRRLVLYPRSKKDYPDFKVLEPGVPLKRNDGAEWSKTMRKDFEIGEPYGPYQKKYYEETIYKMKQKMLESFINFVYVAFGKEAQYKPRLNYHLGMMYLRGDAFSVEDTSIPSLKEKYGSKELEEHFKKGKYFGAKQDANGRLKPVFFEQLNGETQIYKPDYKNLEKAFVMFYRAFRNYKEIRDKDLEEKKQGLKSENEKNPVYQEYFPAVYEAAVMLIKGEGLPDPETLKQMGLEDAVRQKDLRGEGFRILHLLSKDGSLKAANLTAEYYIDGKAYEQAKKYLKFALDSTEVRGKGKSFYLLGKIHEDHFKETKKKEEIKEAYQLYQKALKKGSHLGYLGLGRIATFYPDEFFELELENQFNQAKQKYESPESKKSYLRRYGKQMPSFDELPEKEKQSRKEEIRRQLIKNIKSFRHYYLKQTIIKHSDAQDNFVESSKAKLEASYILSMIYQNGKLGQKASALKAFQIYRPYVIDLIREIKKEYLSNGDKSEFIKANRRIKNYASKITSITHMKMLFEFSVMVLRNQITRQQLADLSGNSMWEKGVKEKSAIRILQILHEKGYKPASYLFALSHYAYTEVFYERYDKYDQAINYFEQAKDYSPALSRLGEIYYLGAKISISKHDQIRFLEKHPDNPLYLVPGYVKAITFLKQAIKLGEKDLANLKENPLSDFEKNLIEESLYRSKHYLSILQIKQAQLFEKKPEDQKRIREMGMKQLKQLANKKYSLSQYELAIITYFNEENGPIKETDPISPKRAKEVFPLLLKILKKTPISDRRDIKDVLDFSWPNRISYINWIKSKYLLARMYYEGVEGVVKQDYQKAFKLYEELIIPPRNINYMRLSENLAQFRNRIESEQKEPKELRVLKKQARKDEIEVNRVNLIRLTHFENLVNEVKLSERSKSRIGLMYAEGLGLKKDLVKAYAYLHASYDLYKNYKLIPQEVEEAYHQLDTSLSDAQKYQALNLIKTKGLYYNKAHFDSLITSKMGSYWGKRDNRITKRVREKVFGAANKGPGKIVGK